MRTKRGKDLRVILSSEEKVTKQRLMRYYIDNVMPESNNTELADILTRAYGSLANIFAMTIEELYTIPFVEEEFHDWVMVTQAAFKRVKAQDEEHNHLFHPELVLAGAKDAFVDKNFENLYVYYIDENGDIFKTFHTTSSSTFRVYFVARELVDDLRRVRPVGIIMMHNHPSGSTNPSKADIDFTNYMQFICEAEGIKALDHFIYSDEGECFSFRNNNRITEHGTKENYRKLFGMMQNLRDD